MAEIVIVIESVMDLLVPIFAGAASGVAIAAEGYFKANEKFNAEKFFYTVALGMIIGASSAQVGMTYQSTWDLMTSIGLITSIEYALKAIWRRWLQPLMAGRSAPVPKA